MSPSADAAQHLDVAPCFRAGAPARTSGQVVPRSPVLAAGDDDHLSTPRSNCLLTPYWMTGLSTSGSISFGCALVAGRIVSPTGAGNCFSERNGTSIDHLESRRSGQRLCRRRVLAVAEYSPDLIATGRTSDQRAELRFRRDCTAWRDAELPPERNGRATDHGSGWGARPAALRPTRRRLAVRGHHDRRALAR